MKAVSESLQPMFSVVTVCFNAKATIAQAIESVQAQQGVSVQHIVIDGGSTDGTVELIQSYAERIDTFKSGRDRGVYDAMQKGLELARGQFTGFLNADDYFAGPDVLSKLAQVLRKGHYLGVSGIIEQVNTAGTVIRTIGRDPLSKQDLLWGKFPPHPATYLDTDLMKEAGGFQHHYRIAGDFDLLIRMLKRSSLPLAHIDQKIVQMRMGGASTVGLSAYRLSSNEILAALRGAGYPANVLKIHGRVVKKLPELVRKMTRKQS